MADAATTSRPGGSLGLLRYILPVLIAGIGCTAIGLVVHFLRLRSRKYALPVSLIITGILSLAGLVAYLFSR